jgi:hypothetical protein
MSLREDVERLRLGADEQPDQALQHQRDADRGHDHDHRPDLASRNGR